VQLTGYVSFCILEQSLEGYFPLSSFECVELDDDFEKHRQSDGETQCKNFGFVGHDWTVTRNLTRCMGVFLL
jgi:hypothetical protein